MTVLARAVLFISSYAPLLVLFALLDSFGSTWATIVCAAVGAISVAALGAMWFIWRYKMSTQQCGFEGASNRDSDVMLYVATYLVPFAAATDDASPNIRWALGLFAILIAALYIRSAVFYIHPLLLICGIHVFDVRRNGTPAVVLTRQRYVRQSCNMTVTEIAPHVYFERPA